LKFIILIKFKISFS